MPAGRSSRRHLGFSGPSPRLFRLHPLTLRVCHVRLLLPFPPCRNACLAFLPRPARAPAQGWPAGLLPARRRPCRPRRRPRLPDARRRQLPHRDAGRHGRARLRTSGEPHRHRKGHGGLPHTRRCASELRVRRLLLQLLVRHRHVARTHPRLRVRGKRDLRHGGRHPGHALRGPPDLHRRGGALGRGAQRHEPLLRAPLHRLEPLLRGHGPRGGWPCGKRARLPARQALRRPDALSRPCRDIPHPGRRGLFARLHGDGPAQGRRKELRCLGRQSRAPWQGAQRRHARRRHGMPLCQGCGTAPQEGRLRGRLGSRGPRRPA